MRFLFILMPLCFILGFVTGLDQVTQNQKAEELASLNPGNQFCYNYKKSDKNGTYCITYKEKKK